jgi:hypothetical protein
VTRIHAIKHEPLVRPAAEAREVKSPLQILSVVSGEEIFIPEIGMNIPKVTDPDSFAGLKVEFV